MNRLTKWLMLVMLGIAFVGRSGPATAQGPAPVSDRMRILDAAGGLVFDQSFLQGSETGFLRTPSLPFPNARSLLPENGGRGNNVTLTEPGVTPFPVGSDSDFIQLAIDISDFANPQNDRIELVLGSDIEGLPFQGLLGATKIEETGELQEITRALFGIDPTTSRYRVFVQSDLDVVPEPETLILLATGFAGLGGIAWRRHRRT